MPKLMAARHRPLAAFVQAARLYNLDVEGFGLEPRRGRDARPEYCRGDCQRPKAGVDGDNIARVLLNDGLSWPP